LRLGDFKSGTGLFQALSRLHLEFTRRIQQMSTVVSLLLRLGIFASAAAI
jgi:type VI protein secretion system component VasF